MQLIEDCLFFPYMAYVSNPNYTTKTRIGTLAKNPKPIKNTKTQKTKLKIKRGKSEKPSAHNCKP